MEETKWIVPTTAASPASAGVDTPVLTEKDVNTWRENGYCLVNGVLPQELLNQLVNDCIHDFPAPLSEEAKKVTYFGGFFKFPSTTESVNELTLHPRLLSAAAQLLDLKDTMDLRLTQSEVWPKYGRMDSSHESNHYDNSDQRMHCDFPVHTLVHPPPWDEPEAVCIIVYLSDVDECLGSTAVVPRKGKGDPAYTYPLNQMPGFGTLKWKDNRKVAEAYLREVAPDIADFRAKHLYAREKQVRYRFGTTFFFRQDIWHRGTVLKSGCRRIVGNIDYRKASAEWINTTHNGWLWTMFNEKQIMEKILATLTVEQRCILGFPKPGHSYWTPFTIAAVAARYEALGMDMKPYIDAMKP